MARTKSAPDSAPSAPREVKQGYTKTIFPKPEAYKLSVTAFEKWLKCFTPECRTRVTLSLYRDWPRINLKQIPGEQYERRIFFYEASLDPSGFVFQPDFSFREFVLHNHEWGGEGEYRLLCNEQGVKGAIGMSEFTLEDPDYPPRVDVRSIVQGFPRNEGFIKGLRVKGVRFPGDDPEQERIEQEEAEMNTNVAAPLVEHVVKQNAELLEELRETREGRDQEPSPEETMLAEATTQAVRVVADGAKEAISMVGTQAKEMAKATAPQFDPLALFKAGREAAGDNMAMFTLLVNSQQQQMQAMREMHEKTLDYMRERDQEREEQAAAAAPVEHVSDLKRLVEQGKELKEAMGLLGFSQRHTHEEAQRQLELPLPAPKESALDKLLGKLAENPAVLVTGIFAVTNLVQTFMGRGRPTEEVAKAAQQVAQGATNGAIQPPTSPSPEEVQKQALANFLKAIHPLFIMHFFDEKKEGLTGYTFAEDFLTAQANEQGQLVFTPEGPMTELGQQQYNQIRQGGPIQFDRIIRDYTPIWSLVGGQMPRYTQFMKEFFEFPEAAQKAAEERRKEREKKVTQVPPPPTN